MDHIYIQLVVGQMPLLPMKTEMNISPLAGIGVSRAVIFKSGCFVQKYWSGTVTLNTVRIQ